MPDTLPEFEPITRNGKPWLRHVPTGREIPVLRGGDGPEDEATGAGTPPPTGPPPATQPPAAGLSQADVDRAVAAAQRKATADTRKQFEEFLAAEKDKVDTAALDDVAKARKEAADAKAEAAKLMADAQTQLQAAKIQQLLIVEGVDAKAMRRAVAAVGPQDPAATDEDLAAAVAATKEDAPGLFAPAAAGQRQPSGYSGARPPAGATGRPPSGIAAGREMAREEAEARKKESPLTSMHVVGR